MNTKTGADEEHHLTQFLGDHPTPSVRGHICIRWHSEKVYPTTGNLNIVIALGAQVNDTTTAIVMKCSGQANSNKRLWMRIIKRWWFY